MASDCEQCGNPIRTTVCPFCGFEQSVETIKARRTGVKEVNLKLGSPNTHEALERLLQALNDAMVEGADRLVVVHGYGSSGRGGLIRNAVRKRLREWQASGRVRELRFGEDGRSMNPGETEILL